MGKANKTRVTRAMIEAGLDALEDYLEDYDLGLGPTGRERLVEKIIRAAIVSRASAGCPGRRPSSAKSRPCLSG